MLRCKIIANPRVFERLLPTGNVCCNGRLKSDSYIEIYRTPAWWHPGIFQSILSQIKQMLELRVRSNAYFLLFDDVFHLLLYGAVVGLDSLFHILIAIIVNECVDCRYWLVCRFLCCYLIGVNHNLGMENLFGRCAVRNCQIQHRQRYLASMSRFCSVGLDYPSAC